ncbi:MAG TPA: substrate-binding domain-containing protein, partial [Xanthomonadaceae bacterium]|nr:substrate-binding domain-containing protein [Xanthomonadaceae bacterium]
MAPRALLVLLLVLLPGIATAQTDAPDRLRINGSNALGARVVPAMVSAWLKQIGYANIKRRDPSAVLTEFTGTSNSGVPIVVDIDKSGTGPGLAALIKGDADVSMSERQPNAKEKSAAWQLGDLTSPDEESVVALTGLVVVVSPNNPVSSLSESQLRDVFAGKIHDWSEFGGTPGPIVPCIRQSGGEQELLSIMVLGDAKIAPTTATYGSNVQVAAAVAADPSRLGIVEVN